MERNEKGEETMNMQEKLDQILGKEISQASNEEIYDALLTIVQELSLIHISWCDRLSKGSCGGSASGTAHAGSCSCEDPGK